MHVWHMPVFAPQSMVCTECAATSCKRHLCSYVCGSCAVVYVSMCGDRYLSGCEPDISQSVGGQPAHAMTLQCILTLHML